MLTLRAAQAAKFDRMHLNSKRVNDSFDLIDSG
jgi:hypothetical protein